MCLVQSSILTSRGKKYVYALVRGWEISFNEWTLVECLHMSLIMLCVYVGLGEGSPSLNTTIHGNFIYDLDGIM